MDNSTTGHEDTRDVGEVAVQAFSMVLIILSAVIGNILILLTVYIDRTLRTITNVFVVNLAIADLLLAVTAMPFSLASSITYDWVFGKTWCHFHGMAVSLFCVASMLTLAAVSIDRYIAIIHPLQYNERMSRRTATIMIVYIWGHSFTVTLLPVFGWSRYIYIRSESICTFDWKFDIACTLFIFVVCFFIPLSVMMFTYYKVLQTARAHSKRIVPVTGRFSMKKIDNERGLQESSHSSTYERDNTFPSQASFGSECQVSRETQSIFIYNYSTTKEETCNRTDEPHRHSEDSGLGDSNQFTNSTAVQALNAVNVPPLIQRNSDDSKSENRTCEGTNFEKRNVDLRDADYDTEKGCSRLLDAFGGELNESSVNYQIINKTSSTNLRELDNRDYKFDEDLSSQSTAQGGNINSIKRINRGNVSLTPIVVPVATTKGAEENFVVKANSTGADQTEQNEPTPIPLYNIAVRAENYDSHEIENVLLANKISDTKTVVNPVSGSGSNSANSKEPSALSGPDNTSNTRDKEFPTKTAWGSIDEASRDTSTARGIEDAPERKPRVSVVISAETPPSQKRERKVAVAHDDKAENHYELDSPYRTKSAGMQSFTKSTLYNNAHKSSVASLRPDENGNSNGAIKRKVSSVGIQAIKDRYYGRKQSNRAAQRFKQDNKAVRTLLIVVGTFILCWFPHFIGIFCLMTGQCTWPDRYFAITTWLAMLNSGCNPVIYGAMSRQFRRRFKQILQCKKGFF